MLLKPESGYLWHAVSFLILCVALPGSALERLHLTALTEVQVGNLPNQSPRDLRTIYQQLNLDYTVSGFQAGLRAESFGTDASGRTYNHLAQRFARYSRGNLQVTTGHFFSILGNGLLMHSFELPAVITEDRGWRRRYQLTRDLDGLHLGYKWNKADITLLRGTPVDSALPPGDLGGPERRDGTVQGGSIEVQPSDYLTGGLGMLQVKAAGSDRLGATLYGRLRLAPLIRRMGFGDVYVDLYGEYTQGDFEADRWFSLDRDLPRALYLSSTITAGPWGLSLEHKDYSDFVIAAVNNPPTLIREHEAFLLNRDTHVLLADDESGVQAELSYFFTGGQSLIANFTRAERRQGPGAADNMDLQSFFIQTDSPLGENLTGQLWVDFARDRIFADENRKSVGSVLDWQIDDVYAVNTDVQSQFVDRTFGDRKFPYKNLYLGLALHRAPGVSLSLLVQRSTDRLETGAAETGATYWFGGSLGWQVHERHSINLFGGKRRTGLACTAGTCYEVLGFEGVEVRLIDQFL